MNNFELKEYTIQSSQIISIMLIGPIEKMNWLTQTLKRTELKKSVKFVNGMALIQAR